MLSLFIIIIIILSDVLIIIKGLFLVFVARAISEIIVLFAPVQHLLFLYQQGRFNVEAHKRETKLQFYPFAESMATIGFYVLGIELNSFPL